MSFIKMGRRFFRTIGLILLSLLLLVVILLTTHWGNKALINSVKYFSPEIKLTLTDGAIFNQPRIENLSINFGNGSLSIDHIALQWNWGCLVDSVFCLDKIDVAGVDLTFNSGEQSTDKAEPSQGTIELPFGIDIKRIAINDVNLLIDGHKVSWQQLHLGVQLKESTLVLDQLTLTKLNIGLAAASQETKTTVANTVNSRLVLPVIELPLAIKINQLVLIDSSLEVEQQVHHLQKLSLDLAAKDSDITIEQFKVEHQLATIELQGKVTLNQQYPLAITTTIDTKADLNVGQNSIAIKLSGALDDLLTNVSVSGDINSEISATINALDSTVPFDILANWQPFSLPNQPYQVGAGEISAQGNLNQFSYALASSVTGSDIPATSAKLTGQGSINDATITELKVNTLNGEIIAQGQVNWQDGVAWQSQLSLNNIEPKVQWPQLNGVLNGRFSSTGSINGDQWRVALDQLDINGQWLDRDLSLSGKINGQSGEQSSPFGNWSIDQVLLANGDNNVLINGHDGQKLDLSSSLNITDLSQSIPDASGKIVGQILLQGNPQQPRLVFDLQGDAINIAPLQLQLSHFSAQGELVSDLNHNNQLSIILSDLKLSEQQINQFNFDLSGSWNDHLATLVLDSEQLSAQLELTGQYQENQWTGSLNHSQLDTPIGQWGAQTAVEIGVDLAANKLSLSPHCWQQHSEKDYLENNSPASLCLTAPVTIGTDGDVAIALTNFNLETLSPLLQQHAITLDGLVAIKANAKWQPSMDLEVSAAVESTQGRVIALVNGEQIINEYQNLLLSLKVIKQHQSVSFGLKSPQIGQLAVNIETSVVSKNQPLSGQLDLTGLNLGAFKQLLPQFDTLNGQINVSTRIAGTATAPLLYGEINVENTNVSGLTLPVQIQQFNSVISFNGAKASVDSDFELGGGLAKITGAFDWEQGLNAQFAINGTKLSVTPETDISVIFSPAMTIDFSSRQSQNDILTIGGEVVVDQGLIKINKLPESAVSLSDDVVIVTPDQQQSQPLPNKLAVVLDLNVIIKEQLKVEAFGLTSALKGHMALSQGEKTPLTGHGELNLVDAKYIAMGQDLEIRRGKMLFNGALSQPFLNIEAIRTPAQTADDVIAGINVTGSVAQPKLVIFSEPAMSQQEALSYLLRGRKINSEDSTTGESMLIGMLLSSGLGRTEKLVDNIGNKLGISDMAVNATGSGDDTAVEVSGYVAKGVEVRYAVGVFDSQPQLTIRYQLMPQLFVDIIKGSDEALDLLYKFDFD